MEAYRTNPDKSILHVGWWLRRLHSFLVLRTKTLKKLILHINKPWINSALKKEWSLADPTAVSQTYVALHLSNEEYDRMLSQNLVFMDVYDSSANNALIECMIRHTPIVVRRHPAIVEYIGPDYPLLFSDVEEAGKLADDMDRVHAAHCYLRDRTDLTERLQGSKFRRQIYDSPIYQRLL